MSCGVLGRIALAWDMLEQGCCILPVSYSGVTPHKLIQSSVSQCFSIAFALSVPGKPLSLAVSAPALLCQFVFWVVVLCLLVSNK